MTLKSFVSLLFNLIGLEDSQTNKDATIPSYIDATSTVQKKTNQSTINNDVGLCCVCLSMLNNKDEILVLPCLHEFHEVCVNSWLNGHQKTCPLCRFSLGAEEKSHHAEMFSDEMLIWFSSFHIIGM